MNEPYYHNKNKFMPSPEVLSDWLNTNKGELLTSDSPRLFVTDNYKLDKKRAGISLLIELAALGLTFYGGYQAYLKSHVFSDSFFWPVVLSVLFVLFDIIGIMFHSSDRKGKVLMNANFQITEDDFEKQRLYKKIKQLSYREFTGVMALIISAFLKIFAVLNYSPVTSKAAPVLILIMAILYIVVIYIHIYHTGYYLSAYRVASSIKKEEKLWDEMNHTGLPSSSNIDKPTVVVFDSTQEMPCDSGSCFRLNDQSISYVTKQLNQNGVSSFVYQLESIGCLWDSDRISLINSFTDGEFKKSLIKACVKLQLSQAGI